jgi:hypothetical protein
MEKETKPDIKAEDLGNISDLGRSVNRTGRKDSE